MALARMGHDMGKHMSDPKANVAIDAIVAQLPKGKIPPVETWQPDFSGDLDMRIARDGSWFYLGSPIKRKKMVRMFASILRHDLDGKYYLVTPVEKFSITVDDAPFQAVAMEVHGEGRDQALIFRTNVDDEVMAGPEHPIRVVIDPDTEEPSPYVHVRARLEALISRAIFYDLVDLAVEEDRNSETQFGIWSAGVFFPIGSLP
jgi:uncharacterized protein